MMDDNNYKQEEFDNCFLCKHPALKMTLIGLLIFLGAFVAFYVVSDWHFKRMYDPAVQIRNMDKAIMKREKAFDKMERKALKQQQWIDKKTLKMQDKFAEKTASFIHLEKNKDNYRIIIDLKHFNNSEKNIEVRTDGNTVIINAASENVKGNKTEVVKYSQAFNFGEKINDDEISKVRDGNNYIITVPFEE